MLGVISPASHWQCLDFFFLSITFSLFPFCGNQNDSTRQILKTHWIICDLPDFVSLLSLTTGSICHHHSAAHSTKSGDASVQRMMGHAWHDGNCSSHVPQHWFTVDVKTRDTFVTAILWNWWYRYIPVIRWKKCAHHSTLWFGLKVQFDDTKAWWG